MPCVLQLGKVKICIYFHDHGTAHVHAIARDCKVKIYIDSLGCEDLHGFNAREIKIIQRAIAARREYLKEKWDEYQKR